MVIEMFLLHENVRITYISCQDKLKSCLETSWLKQNTPENKSCILKQQNTKTVLSSLFLKKQQG